MTYARCAKLVSAKLVSGPATPLPVKHAPGPWGEAETHLLGRHDGYRVFGRDRDVVRPTVLFAFHGPAELRCRWLVGTAEVAVGDDSAEGRAHTFMVAVVYRESLAGA
jgi:hypothetical protein